MSDEVRGHVKREAIWLFLGVALACVGVFLFLPAIPQDPAYHKFADQRSFLGVPRFLDVISNLGFLFVGAWALIFVACRSPGHGGGIFSLPSERWSYYVFFVGVLLTAFGSAYYHLAQDNARLIYDRLPMTVGFTALLSSVIAERVDEPLGLWLLGPLVAIGLLSVLYWRWTEVRGRGDLRLYGIVQFGTVLIIFVLAAVCRARYTRGADIFLVGILYVAAKLFESLDRPIFSLGRIVSGHTLKHLFAALACYFVLRMIALRRVQRIE